MRLILGKCFANHAQITIGESFHDAVVFSLFPTNTFSTCFGRSTYRDSIFCETAWQMCFITRTLNAQWDKIRKVNVFGFSKRVESRMQQSRTEIRNCLMRLTTWQIFGKSYTNKLLTIVSWSSYYFEISKEEVFDMLEEVYIKTLYILWNCLANVLYYSYSKCTVGQKMKG